MGIADAGFGFLAGVLSLISPCVLPLLPLVLGAAASAHRFGAVMLAAGLVVSFVAMGSALAAAGLSLGAEALFRNVSVILLGLFGVLLLSETLRQRFAVATASVSGRLMPSAGLTGQFTLGLILGVAWSPCAGPTLGAASMLAANGRDVGHAALVMGAFALGAAVPLVVVGSVSRRALERWRGPARRVGKTGSWLLGAAMVTTAGLILSGQEHALETMLVDASPSWLIDAATRF